MAWHIRTESVEIPAGIGLGIRIGNPQNPEKATVLVLLGKKGMIVCRNFDILALEARGVAAARVQGIASFEEMLRAPIESCTAQAKDLGISVGMKGEEALSRLL